MTSIKFRALTNTEHKLFFEALGEYGKDFQNIQQYISSKGGKTSSKAATDLSKTLDPQERKEQDKKEEDKKREQIRNFYNKLNGKLSEWFGNLDDRVEKVNQELYLLINYGEIWKKYGFKFKFNNKTKKLLEELVYQGYTSLRFNNRQVRLRTPPCKALKKINKIGIDEKVKVVTSRELPKDVIVEFHPARNRDWLKVQSMSQNPRVRAKLSIQRRMTSIVEFLEEKWNISQEKLNRTVDAWLKVPPNTQLQSDEQQSNGPNYTSNSSSLNQTLESHNQVNVTSPATTATTTCETQSRLRLKTSAQHELNEVNITRVIPDNHLDLSLNAYIKRMGDSAPKTNEPPTGKSTGSNKDFSNISNHLSDEGGFSSENLDCGNTTNNSRLPLSLTTPDSSILFERSMTSDQPSIAQARKHLNLLQTLATSFEGCENSRTACEDTQDRSLPTLSQNDSQRLCSSFGEESIPTTASRSDNKTSTPMPVNNIPELFDEDAAIGANLSVMENTTKECLIHDSIPMSESQNSKSVDFSIPKDLTLGEYFKMTGHREGGDEANDAFPTNLANITETIDDPTGGDKRNNETFEEAEQTSVATTKPQNHMIEMKKFAEGWTRQEESSMTIGELYLAFKCPEKIILEYEFEQFIYENDSFNQDSHVDERAKKQTPVTSVVQEASVDNTLIFKLLTAAGLSLAQIEHQRQEQLNQPMAKIKRRRGPSNPNTIKFLKRDDNVQQANSNFRLRAQQNSDGDVHGQTVDNNNYTNSGVDKGQGQQMSTKDIEARNQRVEEALKQLQPTRLSVFRRAR